MRRTHEDACCTTAWRDGRYVLGRSLAVDAEKGRSPGGPPRPAKSCAKYPVQGCPQCEGLKDPECAGRRKILNVIMGHALAQLCLTPTKSSAHSVAIHKSAPQNAYEVLGSLSGRCGAV
eukprot:scaffold803_cov310-Pinguiococcus_pyrenoidosus.AAC.49